NLFFKGLQEAWRHHLAKLWSQRKLDLGGREPASLIVVPAEALYYACLGCVEIGQGEKPEVAIYQGREKLAWWVETGQHEQKAKDGARGLVAGAGDLATFVTEYVKPAASRNDAVAGGRQGGAGGGGVGLGSAASLGAPAGEIGFLRGIWRAGSRRLAWLEDYAAAVAAPADLPAPEVL